MREVVIVSAARTAVGAFQGSLSAIPATDLGAYAIVEAMKRANISSDDVDEVIMGNVLPCGLGQNPARQALIKGGLSYDVEATTVNKVCGSGLKAVMLGTQAIMLKDADVIVAGGMENMNMAPYFLEKARTGYRMGHGKLLDSMIHDGLWCHVNDFHMGMSAELCAEKYEVSRKDQDEFAVSSYNKALKAQREGGFDEEIFPVEVPQRKGPPVIFTKDEVVRETSMEALAKLPPAFKRDGTVTAGNASKISDGAAAVVLMAREKADSMGLKPLARVGVQCSVAIDPKYVLIAPIYGIPKLLKKAGLTIADIDIFEINEAFSSSTVAIIKTLKIDPARVNLRGGAVAMGHPIGASGARVLVTLLYLMKDTGARRGMASLCLGGGEAVCLLIERE
ncbi:MAG: acetyl-CoA C-acyltransferase [Deltaproteobacteria bacterium]|nr:MAG: acetyl-CoA C-acyltransferase [Deltaproteobacteria bacterium]RLB90203.1 MAG: acetyl-CoA C-acyltransferase [Deltaproteobacteria bacterium]